jgi:hypothetical protein
MIANAFNTPRLCMLTGEVRPLGYLKPTPRDIQLYLAQKSSRAKFVLANSKNQIAIASKAESDKKNAIKGVRI